MKVLVDTCVWSQVLRRNHEQANPEFRQRMTELINENRVVIIGPIRQELLSGIRDEKQFKKLHDTLSVFPDITIETKDYVKAATICNFLRQNGIQGSSTDYLICSITLRHNFAIYTTDHDFNHYKRYIPINLVPNFL